MKSLVSLSVILAFVFVFVHAQQDPAWCAAAKAAQAQVSFSHCSTHDSTRANDPLPLKSSWCSKTNYHASLPISFRDPDFLNNCTELNSHCVTAPSQFDQILGKALCVDDTTNEFTFVPAPPIRNKLPDTPTSYNKRCIVVQHAIPFELYSDFNKDKRKLLFISTAEGFVVVDMGNERLLHEQTHEKNQLQHVQVLSGAVATSAHAIGASGKSISDYQFTFDANGNFKVNLIIYRKDLVAPVVGLDVFFDVASATSWAAVLGAENGNGIPSRVDFYQIGKMTPGQDTVITWKYVYIFLLLNCKVERCASVKSLSSEERIT
jgi:hypothetical protein